MAGLSLQFIFVPLLQNCFFEIANCTTAGLFLNDLKLYSVPIFWLFSIPFDTYFEIILDCIRFSARILPEDLDMKYQSC